MKKAKSLKKRAEKRTAVISVRLNKDMIAKLSALAGKFDVTRNNLVVAVLHEYLTERGEDGIAEIIVKRLQQARDGKTLDLFA